MAGAIKSYRLQITQAEPTLEKPGVRAASRSTSLLDSLESVQHPGIFFAGEALDVDGVSATISSGHSPWKCSRKELQQEDMHDSDTAIKNFQSPTHRRNWNRK